MNKLNYNKQISNFKFDINKIIKNKNLNCKEKLNLIYTLVNIFKLK